MSRISWFVLCGALALSGCDSCKASLSTPEAPAPQAPRAQALAWTSPDGSCPETVWLQAREGGGAQVEARARELVVADAEHLWVLRDVARKVKMSNCACQMEEAGCPAGQEQVEQTVEVPVLQDLLSAASYPLAEVGDTLEEGEYGVSAELLGSAGSLLFVRRITYGYSCGAAHGGTGGEFLVLDLSGPSIRTLPGVLNTGEQTQLEQQARPAALQKLRSREEYTEDLSGGETSLTLYYPSFKTLDLRLRAQFTTGGSYAGSDGAWSSYTLSETVDSDLLPEQLKALAQTPEPVRSYWKEQPPGEHAGWSLLPADATRLERGLTAFRGLKQECPPPAPTE